VLENKIRIINAGAGSGKTFRLTKELSELLENPMSGVRPEGIVATTFTRKSAHELVERLRQALFKKDQMEEAERLSAGFISTVNGVCGALLQKIAFEAGISPRIEIIEEEDMEALFSRALAEVVDDEIVADLEKIGECFGGIGWKTDLKVIVDAARSNNCQTKDLQKFAQKSLAELKKFLPEKNITSADVLDTSLSNAIDTAIVAIKKNTADTTKGTAKYLQLLEGAKAKLKAGQVLTWAEWVGLANDTPTKSSESLALPVMQAASMHGTHPRFHENLDQYITNIFDLARITIEHYQNYKRERGLMDYVDQEALFLAALDVPQVRERLKEELDLLLVDEFQDTSPIQLALFLKMSALVEQSVWVGDPKQSIYGFRGADPALMSAIVKAVPVRSGDILGTSYRSRPDLVRFVNSLFVPAMADLLTSDLVKLEPHRPDPPGASAALTIWPLQGSNKELRMGEIADGIVGLLAEAPIIYDKPNDCNREAVPGDIAVLCRSHVECREVAKALAARGVRVAIGRPGLVETPEGKLIVACLRYFMNEYDTLANAEIQVLTSLDPDPEVWLAERIQWLEEGNSSHEWEYDHPALFALRKLSARAINFSPSEVLDEIIEAVDMRRLLIGWGERERRLGNLENFRELIRRYEESCRRQMSAATSSGFLLWLSVLAQNENDSQAEGRGVNAVNILTCHSAKGLEWPIVIAVSLDTATRDRIWGVTVLDERKEVSLDMPLANRWIRYWPWPYSQKKKNTGLMEAMQGKDVMTKARSAAEAEELRLLYVVLTRARDYLVLCHNNKGNAWLDLVLGKANLALPSSDKNETVSLGWQNEGKDIQIKIQYPQETDPVEARLTEEHWVAGRSGKKQYPVFRLNPSKMELPAEIRMSAGKPMITGRRLEITGKPIWENLGHALHGFIAIDHDLKRSLPERVARLDGLLARYGVSGAVDSGKILDNCDGLYTFIKQFNPTRTLSEWPIQMKTGEQVMVGTVDMILDTPAGWIVIDHKSFPGMQSQWPQEAEGYAGQLYAYSDALSQATEKSVIGTYIHFIVGGGIIEIIRS
jgi:ATP-dependent helicase/nuclease subunit A